MSKALAAVSWVVLFVSGLFAFYMLFVGLTFGFALWNPNNPKPTLLWLGVLAAPCVVAISLNRWRNSLPAMALAVLAACGLIGVYLADAFSNYSVLSVIYVISLKIVAFPLESALSLWSDFCS